MIDTSEIMRLAAENAKHIATLNDDFSALSKSYQDLKLQIAIIGKDVEWLLKFFWIAVTASVGAFITNLWQLYKMRK